VKALYAKIESEFGTVDVLVNNAGSGKSALPIKDVDPEDFWYDFVSKSNAYRPPLDVPNWAGHSQGAL
jgi:NADP-dependent 3-hydroxy acid dehydrogenase YdfG